MFLPLSLCGLDAHVQGKLRQYQRSGYFTGLQTTPSRLDTLVARQHTLVARQHGFGRVVAGQVAVVCPSQPTQRRGLLLQFLIIFGSLQARPLCI